MNQIVTNTYSATMQDMSGFMGQKIQEAVNDAVKRSRNVVTSDYAISQLQSAHPYLKNSEIPSELVTASGSGLDPNISVQGAKVQAKRIAESRKISEEKVLEIIKKNTEKPLLGMLGTEKINVLQLNIELDKLK